MMRASKLVEIEPGVFRDTDLEVVRASDGKRIRYRQARDEA